MQSMSRGIEKSVDHVVTTIFNVALVGGVGYCVYWKGASPWLVMVVFFCRMRSSPCVCNTAQASTNE